MSKKVIDVDDRFEFIELIRMDEFGNILEREGVIVEDLENAPENRVVELPSKEIRID